MDIPVDPDARVERNTRQRFIPFRRRDIVHMCLSHPELQLDNKSLKRFFRLLENVIHYEFQSRLERLKNAYAAVDPDSDTRQMDFSEADSQSLVETLSNVLDKANYEKLSERDLEQALNEASMFKIRLQVDFNDFAQVLLFCRNESVREESIPTWFGLRQKTIRFTNYDRVVVFLRLKQDYDTEKSSLPASKPGSTMLKLFQNVPKADLEMLFPNTRVRMRLKDKLMIGVPAVISGGIVITTKLGAALVVLGSLIGFWIGVHNQPVELDKTAIVALLAGFGALGAYLWKQFSNFKNRKLRFMQTLTQNLYFKNLDNNAGVLFRLIDEAEEEESKEAILAYTFLCLYNGELQRHQLDKKIEHWLRSEWQCEMDFEIGDALEKLLHWQLITEQDGVLSAVDPEEAFRKLDARWDAYFES